MKSELRFLSVISVVTLGLTSMATSAIAAGHESSGGGDPYVLDFVKTANQVVYPWLEKNGQNLKPAVNAGEFLLAVDPKEILSQDHVFESCDGSGKGREVAACFNAKTGQTQISRALYLLNSSSPSQLGLVAHEVFRKLGIEGDLYEITQQMTIAQESKIINATKIFTTGVCDANRNDAALRTVQISLQQGGIGKNAACDQILQDYYRTASEPIKEATILRSSMDSDDGHSSAPNGEHCDPNFYLGYVTLTCTMSIR